MLGITLGIGKGWDIAAKNTAIRMHRFTGLKCHAITTWPNNKPLAHPYWAKLRLQSLFPGEDLLFFDADLLCQNPWDPKQLLEDSDFCWCIDPHHTIKTECNNQNLDAAIYGNTGLMIIRSGCDNWRRTQTLNLNCGRWPEQTAINLTVQNGDYAVTLLPSTYNYQIRKHQHTHAFNGKFNNQINLHFLGLGGSIKTLLQIQERLPCG
jgi:lipopolysaccharide biosynthesis glycosyltransferase